MFCPRVHQKNLQVAIPNFCVTVDPPPVCAIAASYATILMDRRHELRLAFWNDRIFDRNQHRSAVKVGGSLFDDNRHAPVVPWTQIRGRLRKFCEEHEHQTPDCSNSGTNKSDSDACSLGYRAPSCAPKSEAPLINQNEDCKHSRSYPIRGKVLHQSADQGNESYPGRTANEHHRSKCAQSV